MLEHLFSSKTRLKLLTLFLRNPEKRFFVRELTRQLDERINSIRRELENLSKIGLLTDSREEKKRYYQVNKNFNYYQELRSLILKASTMPREKIARLFEEAGKTELAILSGRFTQSRNQVDVFLVGDFKREAVQKVIEKLEKEQGSELNYSVMKIGEYLFRKDFGDRFIKSLYDNDHIILINKIKERKVVERKKPRFVL